MPKPASTTDEAASRGTTKNIEQIVAPSKRVEQSKHASQIALHAQEKSIRSESTSSSGSSNSDSTSDQDHVADIEAEDETSSSGMSSEYDTDIHTDTDSAVHIHIDTNPTAPNPAVLFPKPNTNSNNNDNDSDSDNNIHTRLNSFFTKLAEQQADPSISANADEVIEHFSDTGSTSASDSDGDDDNEEAHERESGPYVQLDLALGVLSEAPADAAGVGEGSIKVPYEKRGADVVAAVGGDGDDGEDGDEETCEGNVQDSTVLKSLKTVGRRQDPARADATASRSSKRRKIEEVG